MGHIHAIAFLGAAALPGAVPVPHGHCTLNSIGYAQLDAAEFMPKPLDQSSSHPWPHSLLTGGWFMHLQFVYALCQFSVGAIALGVALTQVGWDTERSLWLLPFFLLYGLFTISVGYKNPRAGYVSFDRVAQVASILVLGPVAAACVNGLASLLWPLHRLRGGQPLRDVATASLNNAGLMTLMTLGCGLLYVGLSGAVPLAHLDSHALWRLLVMILCMQATNELLMAAYLRLKDKTFAWTLQGFAITMEVSAALAGVLVAIVMNRMEPAVVALLLTILGLGMVALKQFARMRTRLEVIVDERTQVLRDKTLELEHLATRDQLTGLFNRRYADDTLRRRIELFERDQRTFSIALIDLDHFKSINDQHSHEMGDDVLRKVAAILLGCCRDTDMLARYGGEEFLVCFPQTGAATAASICDQFRHAVQTVDWSAWGSGINVTLSAGIAEMKPGLSRSALLNSADGRLYKAKHAGRNLVVLT
jgi:diguanylate cyclase (GGDEF)-like protein